MGLNTERHRKLDLVLTEGNKHNLEMIHLSMTHPRQVDTINTSEKKLLCMCKTFGLQGRAEGVSIGRFTFSQQNGTV